MRRRSMLRHALTIGMVAALGCEDPTTSSRTRKPPPPGGGGPRVIAFTGSDRNTSNCIRTMAADGSNVVTVRCPDATLPALWEPSWKPGGTALAYRVVGEGSIHRIDIAADGSGTNDVQLLTTSDCGGSCGSPKWSPLGNEIAVLHPGTSGPPTVLIIPATGCPFPGGGPCPLVLYTEPVPSNSSFNGLTWSPDGTQLALTVSRGPVGESPRFVVLVNRATGMGTDLHQFVGSTLDWGTGSRSTILAITVTPPGVTAGAPRDIYFFDVATPGIPPQLAFTNGRHASFSPDGEFLAYQETSGRFSLVKREIDTGTRTVLQREGSFPDWR